jgi:hypothetical protein
MSEAMTAAARDANGRFMAGQSGNPAGKKPGTRNRATLLCEELTDGEATRVARILIDKALAGDAVAARFLIDRLMPRPRDRAIELDLPAGGRAIDALAASNATVAAMAAGEITPDEALRVTRVLDGRLRALKAAVRESAMQRSKAGQSHLREAAATPRPNGEREGPAPQAWEGEGEAQLPSSFRQQMRQRKLPLTSPSPGRWVPSSPRGARSASSLHAIALSRPFDKSSGGRGISPAHLLHSTCIATASGAVPGARVPAFS